MTQAKHTPGPWRWTTADYGEIFSTYKENGPFDALWSDRENRPVFVAQDASSYAASCDFKKDEDASLIAAAPEMLELLELIESAGEDQFMAMDISFARDYMRNIKALCIHAIAKAKGK